jgi:hypothetical protein
VGSAGFCLDLAVVDPRRSGRYLLGIALDGPNYALDAAGDQEWRSARDRDRLCPHMLQALGWRIHRIWSTEWFRNPDGELQRLVQSLEEAQARVTAGKAAARPANVLRHVPIERDDNETPPREATNTPAYELARLSIAPGQPLHTISTATLASWVTDVVRVESPVHVNEVARRIADAAGCSRIGSRIQGILDGACRHALGYGKICRQGCFLWLKEMRQPIPRDRSRLPASSRKLEFVAPEELAAAIERVVSEAYGMVPDHIPSAVCRLLGFSRVSGEIRAQVALMVDLMVANKRLVAQGDHLVLRTG